MELLAVKAENVLLPCLAISLSNFPTANMAPDLNGRKVKWFFKDFQRLFQSHKKFSVGWLGEQGDMRCWLLVSYLALSIPTRADLLGWAFPFNADTVQVFHVHRPHSLPPPLLLFFPQSFIHIPKPTPGISTPFSLLLSQNPP